jgi:hypothetical protein
MTSWSVWYIQAILYLGAPEAKDLLVRLLSEQEYELDAAWGLFQLSRTDPPSPGAWPRGWPMRPKDFNFVWRARAGESEIGFVEPLRTELAGVLKAHIQAILVERSTAAKLQDLYGRLRDLAVVLAELDGRASFQLVLDILSFPESGRWLYGAWPRINCMEALLMQGVVLPSARTWEVLEPVIQHATAHRYDSQQMGLLTHVACIVLFTDDVASDISRVGQLVEQNRFSIEGVRTLMKALGVCRCDEALVLLRQFVETEVLAQQLGDMWIDAIYQVDSEDSRNLLLAFVDPSLPPVPMELIRQYDGGLVAKLAEMVTRHADVQARLFALAHTDLPRAQGVLLGKVLAKMGTMDAILHALDLLRDDDASGASYELHKRIEDAFIEHRLLPGSSNTYTLIPRTSEALRESLLDMSQNDPMRKKSAYALLSRIELWRMEHGRPVGEKRSPVLSDGVVWPPEPPPEYASVEADNVF